MDDDGVYVLWWKYSDGSGAGVVRAYQSSDKAEEDLKILKDHGDNVKEFSVTPVDLR